MFRAIKQKKAYSCRLTRYEKPTNQKQPNINGAGGGGGGGGEREEKEETLNNIHTQKCIGCIYQFRCRETDRQTDRQTDRLFLNKARGS